LDILSVKQVIEGTAVFKWVSSSFLLKLYGFVTCYKDQNYILGYLMTL